MFGDILGLGSAVAFGANAIVARRGVLRASSNYIAMVSIFTGPVFFFAIALFTGDLSRMTQVPWQAHFYLALSGVVHFTIGRTWVYRSIQLIGSTRSYIVTSLYPIVSIVLAMLLLGEKMNPVLALGILFSLSGPLLTLIKEETVEGNVQREGAEVDRRTLWVGMAYGAGAALFWGSSAIFIKLGLEKGGSPIGGSLIAYLAASLALSPSLFRRENRNELLHADRESFHLGLLSGMTSNIAQMLKYLALDYGSVIVITLLSRTTPLWVLLISYLFNRKLESFSRWVLLGNALLIIGTILIMI